ncbi:AraC family transcriptional regulator [Actinokineospora sp. PR83]|uniref:helix-turn-helix domain-containing protein n=1 Tax=Actinokineospora sp. PR83 TaxID=2884908 RepID=UPI001F4874B0|nr:AraC family transcriptional regulator [Actinokineospora sp. PR83]MCG8919197.1 AraC family transcriptional regulator [Actinokineospora sp. PR83]
MTYQERRPPGLSGLGVDCVWSRSGATAAVRVLPDACADVIWHRESGALWVAGPDTAAQLSAPVAGTLVGIRFPSAARPLGVPAADLRDARVALADLWPTRRAADLADRLAETPDTATAQRVLVSALAAEPDPLAAALRAMAERTGSVAEMADRLGYSPRQLRRHAHTAFGYGPKVLHRVLRFTRAVSLARAGTPFADVAHAGGFTDQAHLANEVRDLAGTTLGDLVGPDRPQ